MKTFIVAIQEKREITTREVEANDAEEARKILRGQGNILSIKRKRTLNLKIPIELHHRQIIFYRMATMLESKVPTGQALSLMEEHYKGPIGQTCGKLKKQVEAGYTLEKAMKNMGSKFFPETVTALVEAGFRAGNSADALRQAANFEREMETIKKGSMMGIYMSCLYILIASAVIFGTTRFFGPYMMESDIMRNNKNAAIDPMYIMLGNIGEIFSVIFVTLMIVLIFLGTIGRLTFPSFADSIIVKIPFYKELVLAKQNYIMIYSMSLLTKSGISIENVLSLSIDVAKKGKMKDDLKNAEKQNKRGRPWAAEMSSLHPTDRAALGQAFNRQGITHALESIADQYKELYRARIQQLGPTLQMIAILWFLVSGFVLYGQTMMPIMQMAAAGF